MGEKIKLPLGKKKTVLLAVLGVLGVLLVLIGTKSTGKNEKTLSENFNDKAYIEAIENKICNVIEKVTGDDGAEVIVICESGYEHIYVSNGDEEYVTVKTDDGYSLVLYREVYPKISGVSVVCRGGNDPAVQKKIIDIISTALGISSGRICIVGTK